MVQAYFHRSTDKYGNTGTKVKHAADIDQETGEAYAFYKPLYSLPEVTVTGSKNDITNPEGLKNWSRENDPIAYASREATENFANNYLMPIAESAPGTGDVSDVVHLLKAVKDRDYGTLGLAAGAAALPFVTYGAVKGGKNLLREAMYRGVEPLDYQLKDKARDFIPNLIKNSRRTQEERALELGYNMHDGISVNGRINKSRPMTKAEIVDDIKNKGVSKNSAKKGVYPTDQEVFEKLNIAHRRGADLLDAFNMGLRRKQNWDTFTEIGENTFRINNQNINIPHASARETEVPFFRKINEHLDKYNKHLKDLDEYKRFREEFKDYSEKTLKEYGVYKPTFDLQTSFGHFEPGKNRFHIHGNKKAGDLIRGSYTVDVTPSTGNAPIKFTSIDNWDLNPLEGTKLKNLEFLRLVGGKPYTIKNTYDVDPQTFNVLRSYQNGGVPKYQDEGRVEQEEYEKHSLTSAPADVSAQRQFTLDMINSPKYKERLINQGYENPDQVVKIRSNNVASTPAIDADTPLMGPPISLDTLNPMEKRYPQEPNSYAAISNRILLSEATKDPLLKDTPMSSIIAHEFGHAETRPQFDIRPDGMPVRKPTATSTHSAGVPLNSVDNATIHERRNKNPWLSTHHQDAEEVKGDINTGRFLLNNAGVDVINKDLDDADMKILQRLYKEQPGNIMLKRLFENFPDSNDLKYIMNTIAYENNEEQLTQAQYGGNIEKAQTGYQFPAKYLDKQAFVESTWDPKSLNEGSKAAGLTQFRPITVKDIKQRGFVDDSFDIYNPEHAVKAQIAYMNWLGERPYIDKPNQTEEIRAAKTLLAYNRGPGRAEKVLTALKNRGVDIYSNLDWVDEIPDSDKEGRNYIKMILQGQNTKKRHSVQENYQKALKDPKYKYIRDIYAEQTKPKSYTRPYKEGEDRMLLNLKNRNQPSIQRPFNPEFPSRVIDNTSEQEIPLSPIDLENINRIYDKKTTKEEIGNIQHKLDSLGYNIGSAGVDSLAGDSTEAALKQFALDQVNDRPAPIDVEEPGIWDNIAEKFNNAKTGIKDFAKNAAEFVGFENGGEIESYQGGTEVLENIYKNYPGLKNLGEVTLKPDTSFTREKTGIGDIEYFSPTQDSVRYSNYTVPHPSIGTHGILYNPNTNTEQNIALDMLHGMSSADPKYKKLRNNLKKKILSSKFNNDLEHYWKEHNSKFKENDGKEKFVDNYVDGIIRGLLFEGSDEDFENARYSREANEEYLKNKEINNEFDKLNSYIKGYENGGEVLPEQPTQQELPHQEIVSFPTEREPHIDPRVPKWADKKYYKKLYNTDIPKTLAKQYSYWSGLYKSPIGLPPTEYKDIYDVQAFFNSGDWRKGFKNIEDYKKPSHPMLGDIDPDTNTFVPDELNVNTNEEIADYILQENIPVNFKKVERIPINPDGFAPGSATEFADKVVIPSGNITMKDMQEPILANGEMLMPGEEAQFDTDYVVEEKLPKAQDGLTVEGKKLSKKEVDDVRNFVEDDTNFVQEYPYLLPEVVIEDKLDRTNPTAVRNWSKDHDPIAYAAREGMNEAAKYVGPAVGMALAPAGASLLGAGARGLAAAGEATYGALSPYASAAWNTNIPGALGMSSVPGATVGNLINAGFGTHGATHIAPDTKNLIENPSLENALHVGIDALEMLPLIGPGAGMLREGVGATRKGIETLGKLGKSSKPTSAAAIEGVLPTIKQPIPSKPAPWSLQEIPGLHLKSTMSTNPKGLHTQVNKKGQINVENALKFIKNNEGEKKYEIIRKGFGDGLPKNMDYNKFRKVVQDQLIPLERQFSNKRSDYGLDRLGYNTLFENGIGNLVRSYAHDGPLLPSHFQKMLDNIDNPANYYKGYKNKYYISDVNTDGFNTIDEAKTFIKDITNKSIKQRLAKPLENQTLMLSNKNRLGYGSGAHNNPEETLGHIHFLRDIKTPNTLTVTQIQSDAFQGTNRTMPKTKEAAEYSLKGNIKHLEAQKENWKKAVQLPSGNWEYPDGMIMSNEMHLDFIKGQAARNAAQKIEIENFSQKQLLDKSHEERYVQELIHYAAERGDINKLRLPTSETAAKVQGYSKTIPNTKLKELKEEISILHSNKHNNVPDKLIDFKDFRYSPKERAAEIKKLREQIANIKEPFSYPSNHKTILKKYSEQPKTLKKLFGKEPTIVTDNKGNTWYEFDIPKSYLEGKAEIKAFEYGGKL